MTEILKDMMDTLEGHIWLIFVLILLIFSAEFIMEKVFNYSQWSFINQNIALLVLVFILGLTGRLLLSKNLFYIIITSLLLMSLSFDVWNNEYPVRSRDTSLDKILLVLGLSLGVYFLFYIWLFYVFL